MRRNTTSSSGIVVRARCRIIIASIPTPSTPFLGTLAHLSRSHADHFADDLGRRLSGGNEVDRKFMEDFVIFESESLLCNMASFQRSMTMAVTRQIQKIVIVSWRRSWKKALAEEAEASKVTT